MLLFYVVRNTFHKLWRRLRLLLISVKTFRKEYAQQNFDNYKDCCVCLFCLMMVHEFLVSLHSLQGVFFLSAVKFFAKVLKYITCNQPLYFCQTILLLPCICVTFEGKKNLKLVFYLQMQQISIPSTPVQFSDEELEAQKLSMWHCLASFITPAINSVVEFAKRVTGNGKSQVTATLCLF